MNVRITGGNQRSGKVLVEPDLTEGHTVIMCGRETEKILDLRFGCDDKHRFDIVDVAQANKVDVWFETVDASHGLPDLLINNAALMNEQTNRWEMPTKEFHQLIDVYVKSVFNVIRAFSPSTCTARSSVFTPLPTPAALLPRRLTE